MPSPSSILRCASCGTLNRVPVGKIGSRPLCGSCRTPLAVPSEPVDATSATFDREMSQWQEFLLLEFWNPTCGHCRAVEPVVRDLARWKAGRLKVLLVNVLHEPALAQRFGATATPTFILFRQGRQLSRMDGAPGEKLDMVRWIDRFLG